MNSIDIYWRQAVPERFVTADQIHVWQVSLETSALQTEMLLGILSEDEFIRSTRFHFEQDRKKFIAARGFLRQLLGGYLDKDPKKLRFEYTIHGKPQLVADTGSDALQFSVSHSDMTALYAISPDRKVGIDIERIRYDFSFDQIVKRFFTEGEMNKIGKMNEKNRNKLFFQYWTRKEALLKARGEGLSFPMENIDVSFIKGGDPTPVILPGPEMVNSRWYIQDVNPGTGFTAAIAVEESHGKLTYLRYLT